MYADTPITDAMIDEAEKAAARHGHPLARSTIGSMLIAARDVAPSREPVTVSSVLLREIIRKLPEPGAVFDWDARRSWSKAMKAAFDLVYKLKAEE